MQTKRQAFQHGRQSCWDHLLRVIVVGILAYVGLVALLRVSENESGVILKPVA